MNHVENVKKELSKNNRGTKELLPSFGKGEPWQFAEKVDTSDE